jgi:osmoprotectant transport system substrate-binding protein
MSRFKFRPLLLSVLALSLVAAACGSSGSPSTTTSKESLTFGAFNFNESAILMYMYGKALESKGYTVTYKANLGNREIVEPALASGQIDFYAGYAATDLEFINKGKGEATSDPQATTDKLNTYLSAIGAKALNPSPTVDGNAFAVTKATADKYHLTKISDLAPVAGQMVLGGPTECPTRPFCQLGLQNTYGLHFKDFKALDAGGPLTKTALKNGDIDVGLVFSSDGGIAANNFVVLEDDKHLQNADNVVPIIKTAKLNSEITDIFNKISAALNTADLTGLNKSADIDKQDPADLAATWDKDHGFTK